MVSPPAHLNSAESFVIPACYMVSSQNPGAAIVKKQTSYLAYLLRLWRVKEEGKTTCRASLQSPQTRERSEHIIHEEHSRPLTRCWAASGQFGAADSHTDRTEGRRYSGA